MSTRIDDGNNNSVGEAHRAPQRHMLATTGAEALRALGQFYQTALRDADNVAYEWQNEFRNEQGRSQMLLDMLGEIAKMPGIKKRPDEGLPAAVARHLVDLTDRASKAWSHHGDLQIAYRNLCDGHNLQKPCERFQFAEGVANCVNCNHPEIVHPWPEMTAERAEKLIAEAEAAS